MTSLETALRLIGSDLSDLGVSFALVGGLAVSIRTEPRFTRDADLAVTVSNDTEAEALITRLQNYRLEAVLEQEAVGRLSTVRLIRAADPGAPVVDLLFASSGIEPEVVEEADSLELLPGLRMRVAQTGHLIALKVLSRDDLRRPQDLTDLRALLRVASPADLERAKRAVRLITARGYSRSRALVAELSALVHPSPPSS